MSGLAVLPVMMACGGALGRRGSVPLRPGARCCHSRGMRVGVFLLAARFPGQSDEEVLAATVRAAVRGRAGGLR